MNIVARKFFSFKVRFRFQSSSRKIIQVYQEEVERGAIQFDSKQFKLVKLFQKLAEHVENSNPFTENVNVDQRLRGIYIYGGVGTGKTMLMDFFYNNCATQKKMKVHFNQFMLNVHRRLHERKKMLIEIFGRTSHINTKIAPDEDPFLYVAKQIREETTILCFDEFQVTDVCDALIMRRLFDCLWNEGVILIATSNRAPSELYLDGLNRQYFLPFIDRLQSECIVRHLDTSTDYRLLKGDENTSIFLTNEPQLHQRNDSTYKTYGGSHSNQLLEGNSTLWMQYHQFLTELNQLQREKSHILPHNNDNNSNNNAILASEVSIPVPMGRFLSIPSGHLSLKVCFISFDVLLGRGANTGAADFHALCHHFHTVFLDAIPALPLATRHNEARRLVTFIDEVYLANVRLIWTAEKPPLELFELLPNLPINTTEENSTHQLMKYSRNFEQPLLQMNTADEDLKCSHAELTSIQDLAFACKRASSRMIEMTGKSYLRNWKEKYGLHSTI
mmetsp:Transcript_32937/g.47602  ORF Transcript_32937/g.47602 Transcript_32937/m.47602 type:complete len:502 (+) Transcript_32937:3-1508(+)